MSLQEDDLDDVVISGIGGKFPESENVSELAKKLFAGENLVTKDVRKLTRGFYENLPEYNGKCLGSSDMFDNTFFGISAIVAAAMDPLTCQILQRTFEAIIDAGINPSELRGTNSSVFTGTCHSDSDLEWATDTRAGYGIMGRNRCMNSNRISYWLDINGTSISTDSGWTNGISNLFLGWNAIKSGKCDTAIIATGSIQWHPLITIQFRDFGNLSPDGISRPFDDSANGVGRSSAVVVFVLQKARLARRRYATIGHIFSTCYGDREEIINKPSQRDWEALFNEFYSQSKIDVNDIVYIEANGASTREDDAEELNAITEVFCKNRTSPLLIGSIKSNIGHTEAASAFCGIVKTIIAMESGIIPKNLHYNNPNSLVPGLAKEKLKVVDKNTKIPENGWFAINAHGFGGTYAHIVIKPNSKRKSVKYDNIPRLILLADRTENVISELIEKVENTDYDPEFISLLHEVHSRRVEKYLARGYTILPKINNPVHEYQAFGEEKRPIWFIFSGMGSQWPKMGKRLMDLPIFRESIEKSHKVLQAQGLDLIKIISADDPKMFDNILHSFVGIAAIQIALVDILRTLKITPDGLIGHSVGELGCAYADGCFTAEQMILAAYYRGRASTETELIKGSMAAVGKGYKDIKDQLPEGIEVACHNSSDSCTLSGPTELIHKFVSELKDEGVFAKSVNVSNIAYHSQYIRPAAPKLLEYLKKVVTEPKLRSSKWISTSNPEDKWDTDVARYCSAEYHTNNLLSSVLFEEGSKHIPKNAICIEIAPHGLLQAILKRSLGEEVTNIPLTSRVAEDPLMFLLQAIGKMYIAGVNPNIIDLYPRVEYPVSRGTEFLHSLVHWHEQKAAMVVTPMEKKISYSLKNRLVNLANDGTGYIVNNKNIYPISVFLHLAWEIFASLQKKEMNECPVVFQNIRLEHPVCVYLSEEDNLTIQVHVASGNFEFVSESLVAQGNVSLLKEQPLTGNTRKLEKVDLERNEIFEEIKRKGYEVGDHFKTLNAVSFGEEEMLAELSKTSNWIQTIETMIQLHILQSEESLDCFSYPCRIERLEISSVQHEEYRNSLCQASHLTIVYDQLANIATCGGIKMKGLKSKAFPNIKSDLKFETTHFLPLVNPPLENVLRFASFCFGLVLDNMNAIKNVTHVSVLELVGENQSVFVGNHLKELFPDYKMDLNTVKDSGVQITSKETADFLIGSLTSVDKYVKYLVNGGFVLVTAKQGTRIPVEFTLIGKYSNGGEECLFLKTGKTNVEDWKFITAGGNTSHVMNALKDVKQSNVYLVRYEEPLEGIDNFKKQIQGETIVPLRWIFILDKKAPPFDSKHPFYAEQLRKGLLTNVYKNGAWGWFYLNDVRKADFKNNLNFTLETSTDLNPCYVAVDFNDDVLKLRQIEYSGKYNNSKIMGIGKLLNHKKLVYDRYLAWEIPDSWSLEDGASAVLSYAIAYYCLVILARTRPFENVLVTNGINCIGQASIAVGLTVARRVFVTVNNQEEAGLLKKKFPRLKESDIMCHDNPKFDIEWKLRAKEEYAEVIINFLDGERFFSVVNCSGQFGRIVHFGKENFSNNKEIGLSMFLMSIALYSKTTEIITQIPENEKQQLHELMVKGIKDGVVQPLPRVTFSLKEFQKVKSQALNTPTRIKTLLEVNSMKANESFIEFHTTNSYLIIGDKTDAWVDIAEWLINRSVENIVISRRDHTKRSQLRVPHIKKHKNVFVYDNQDISTSLQAVKKLGQLSAVFFISMDSEDDSEILMTLDKLYRDSKSHLVCISRGNNIISRICAARNEAGYLSTNFIWRADKSLINVNLELMTKLSGRDSVVDVSLPTLMTIKDYSLDDLVPSTMEDFCELGSSLEETVRLTPLPTLAGVEVEPRKERNPLIIVPGLQGDPIKALEPVVANFLYPVICLQIPNINLTIPRMASYILPEIMKLNKGNVLNIVGISWGTHLALELTRQLEDVGVVVGLTLIEGPFFNPKDLVTKSLESDLLNLIQGYFKTTTNFAVQSEIQSKKTWEAQLNRVLGVLKLPSEKEKDFINAAIFLHNNLQGLINHDTGNITIEGPLTVIVSGQKSFDDKILWKMSKSISIQSLSTTGQELMSSRNLWEIIHASAVSQAMSKNTIHNCSWSHLQEFINQKSNVKPEEDYEAMEMKFSFSC